MKQLTYKTAVSAGSIMALALLTALPAAAVEYDLVANQQLNGPNGSIFSRSVLQPTGTGVFQPFLDMHQNPIEEAYNIDGSVALVMDAQRSHWNNLVQVGDLTPVTKNGGSYYLFILDANETGQGNINRLLSVDNIRIYTGSTPNIITGNINSLGTLRYALNNPWQQGGNYNVDNWIKIDSTLGPNAGSGDADLQVYIPVSLFAGASASDYLYFYNLNGVHYASETGTAADAGFEEWRVLAGPGTVPDGGMTVAMLGMALMLMGAVSRGLRR